MTAEALALLIAGIVAPFLVQFIKAGRLSGLWAFWLTVVVSVILAVIAELLTGGLPPSTEEFFVRASAVFALGQVIWRNVFKPAIEARAAALGGG
ncbi:MAG: hypothetical protein M0Z94_00885 [Dehalococcoidales bacterium]|nr:hypothetical protein [Dehalococcoidales bacterium]